MANDGIFLLKSCSFFLPAVPPLTVLPLLCHLTEKDNVIIGKRGFESKLVLKEFSVLHRLDGGLINVH